MMYNRQYMIQVIRRKLHSIRPYIREDVQGAALLGLVVLIMLLSGAGCPIKRFTGIPCPGCGMSRALLCLARLDIAGALRFHPLSAVMPFAAVLWLLRRVFPQRLLKLLAWLLITVLVLCWLLRICSGDPVLAIDIEEGFLYRFIKEVNDVLSELR